MRPPLFLALVSANTESRSEGYFRRELRAAVERTRDMADDRPFLLPVALDATPEATARVPDKFREVQWMRLPSGQVSPAFVQHVMSPLTAGDRSPSLTPATPSRPLAAPSPPPRSRRTLAVLLAAALALIGAYAAWEHRDGSRCLAAPPPSASTPPDSAPLASIAVTPSST